MPDLTHGNEGPATDRHNEPVVDPTQNVLQLVEAAIQRQDDLRMADREVLVATMGRLEERLNGIDRATELRLQGIVDIPHQIDAKVESLRSVMDEKFSSIGTRFDERDTRSERESRDNKVAVDAAFAAQKEAASEQNKSNTLAIDKSERATAETLNKQADLFSSTTDGLAAQIADLKERVSRIESVKQGGQQAYAGIYAAVAFLAVVIGIVGTAIALTR